MSQNSHTLHNIVMNYVKSGGNKVKTFPQIFQLYLEKNYPNPTKSANQLFFGLALDRYLDKMSCGVVLPVAIERDGPLQLQNCFLLTS